MFKVLTHNIGNTPLCVMNFGEHVDSLNMFLRIKGADTNRSIVRRISWPHSPSDINKEP